MACSSKAPTTDLLRPITESMEPSSLFTSGAMRGCSYG
jgi:hypothetical protein